MFIERTQSLTVDEALTYNNFIEPPLGEAFAHYDANNRVLNTLLSRLTVRLFGTSELVLPIEPIRIRLASTITM